MNETIDIYAKILIATFGFIGPSFTLLISIFVDSIEFARIKHEQQLKTLTSLSLERITNPDKDMAKEMKESLKEIEKQKARTKKELNLLNPKRQIRRVFIPLILSLIFIGLYHFQKSNHCPFQNTFYIKLTWLLLSAISFVYCLLVLWQILYVVIEAKQTRIREKKDIIIKPQA